MSRHKEEQNRGFKHFLKVQMIATKTGMGACEQAHVCLLMYEHVSVCVWVWE